MQPSPVLHIEREPALDVAIDTLLLRYRAPQGAGAHTRSEGCVAFFPPSAAGASIDVDWYGSS